MAYYSKYQYKNITNKFVSIINFKLNNWFILKLNLQEKHKTYIISSKIYFLLYVTFYIRNSSF